MFILIYNKHTLISLAQAETIVLFFILFSLFLFPSLKGKFRKKYFAIYFIIRTACFNDIVQVKMFATKMKRISSSMEAETIELRVVRFEKNNNRKRKCQRVVAVSNEFIGVQSVHQTANASRLRLVG